MYSMAEPRPHPPACSVDATARHCSGRDWEEPQKWQQVCRDDSKQWQESLCLSFQTPILTLSASPSTSCVHADTMLDACPASAPPPSWWTHRSPPHQPPPPPSYSEQRFTSCSPLQGYDRAASAWTSRSPSLQPGGERISSIGGFGSFPPWQLGKDPG